MGSSSWVLTRSPHRINMKTNRSLTAIVFFLVFAVNVSVGFIEIEYPKSELVDTRQSFYNITSFEFIGTVFLASLAAFLIIPHIQANYNLDQISRTIDGIAPFILDSIIVA